MLNRQRRSSKTRFTALGAAAVLALAGSPAHAGYSWGANVSSVNFEFAPSIVEVQSEDGATYTKTVAPTVDLSANVQVFIGTGPLGISRIKDWSLWLKDRGNT